MPKTISDNNEELPSAVAWLNHYDLWSISGCVPYNTSNLHSFQIRNRKMNWFTRWRSSRSLEFTAHAPCKPPYYKWISAVSSTNITWMISFISLKLAYPELPSLHSQSWCEVVLKTWHICRPDLILPSTLSKRKSKEFRLCGALHMITDLCRFHAVIWRHDGNYLTVSLHHYAVHIHPHRLHFLCCMVWPFCPFFNWIWKMHLQQQTERKMGLPVTPKC